MSTFGQQLSGVATMHTGYFGESVTYTFSGGTTSALTAIPESASTGFALTPDGEETRGRAVFTLALADLPVASITVGEDRITYAGNDYAVMDFEPPNGATVRLICERVNMRAFGRTHK